MGLRFGLEPCHRPRNDTLRVIELIGLSGVLLNYRMNASAAQ